MAAVSKLAIPMMERFLGFEKDVAVWPEAILPDSDSTERFNIPLEMIRLIPRIEGVMITEISPRTMMSIIRNMRKSVYSLSKNPRPPKRNAPPELISELSEFSMSLGVGHVGFTKVPRKWVFNDKGILYDNAIVLTMEMSREKIDKAPSVETQIMVMETYDELGITANKIADFLREKGYGAHAGHPLGGLALYPPLGQAAGVGWHGRHGLIITPEYGPRVRLAAVFTSIQNLPIQEHNEHSWIRDFCDSCRQCIKHCPGNAVLETPITYESGRMTYVDQKKCFLVFSTRHSCSVCIKVCPFSNDSYSKIKDAFKK